VGIAGENLAAVCFDLFGTLVFFDQDKLCVNGARVSSARRTAHHLAPLLARYFPGLEPEDFASGLEAARIELHEEAAGELYEYPCEERFRRALCLGGVDRGAVGGAEVAALVNRHMENLAQAAFLPSSHGRILEELGERFKLALISNFDHAVTARKILEREKIDRFFSVVVISEEVGRRKPHPAVFRCALSALGLGPERVLHVGDSLIEDVAGAQSVGMRAVWVKGEQGEPSGVSPDFVVPDVGAVAELVTRAGRGR